MRGAALLFVLMKFSDSLRKMETHIQHEMGVGAGADGTPAFLNGSPLQVTTTALEATQTFGMGGYNEMPTMRISVKRSDWLTLGQTPLGKNRFVIGTQELRASRIIDDPLSGEVSFDCIAVDI